MKETKQVTTENKPTEEEIKKRYASYKNYYNALHAEQIEIDDYYELVFDAEVPSRYPVRMPPTAREWIDVGVRHFTLDNPKAKVFLRKDSDAARHQVALLETFYNFFLRKEIGKIKEAAKKLLLRGEVFFKVNMDDTYFGSEDEERLFHFPLFLTVPDPINVYASPAHNGFIPDDVIECFNITVAEAEAMCRRRGWDWSTVKASDKTVKWFSYISNDWRYFSLDDKPVLSPAVQPNHYKFCNYIHVGAGEGQANHEGKPEYQYRSLLWSKKDMLKMEVRLLSSMDAINSRYAFPRWKIAGNMDMIERLYPDGVPTDPNKILYEIPDQVEISILQGEQPPQGLFQEYAFLQSQAQPPAVLAGARPSGVYSGEHQQTLMSSAKPIYKDPFKNLEDGLGIAMGMGARIIEKVYDYAVEIKNFSSGDSRQYDQIKPSDIKGHYDCEVKLLAEPPEATDMRKGLGKSLRVGGSISQLTELKSYQDLSEQEADDEMAQIAAETILRSPGVMEVVGRDAMSRLGMSRELEAIEQAGQEAQQSIAGRKPPIRQSSGVTTGADMVQQRGRVSPELESAETMGEHEAGRTLQE